MVVQHLCGFDVACKVSAAVNGVDHQPPAGKLTLRLRGQVKPVNDEIELRDDALALEIVGKKPGVVVGQCRFTAALGVPDDAFFDACAELLLDGLGGKKLGIAHDVLLHAVCFVDIDQRKTQQESEATATEERRADAIGRRVWRLVAQKLGAVLDDVEIVVTQHFVFQGIVFGCQ